MQFELIKNYGKQAAFQQQAIKQVEKIYTVN